MTNINEHKKRNMKLIKLLFLSSSLLVASCGTTNNIKKQWKLNLDYVRIETFNFDKETGTMNCYVEIDDKQYNLSYDIGMYELVNRQNSSIYCLNDYICGNEHFGILYGYFYG